MSVRDCCVLWGFRVIIPTQGCSTLLKLLHETHPGMSQMKGLPRSYIWWPCIDQEIVQEVRICERRPMRYYILESGQRLHGADSTWIMLGHSLEKCSYWLWMHTQSGWTSTPWIRPPPMLQSRNWDRTSALTDCHRWLYQTTGPVSRVQSTRRSWSRMEFVMWPVHLSILCQMGLRRGPSKPLRGGWRGWRRTQSKHDYQGFYSATESHHKQRQACHCWKWWCQENQGQPLICSCQTWKQKSKRNNSNRKVLMTKRQKWEVSNLEMMSTSRTTATVLSESLPLLNAVQAQCHTQSLREMVFSWNNMWIR